MGVSALCVQDIFSDAWSYRLSPTCQLVAPRTDGSSHVPFTVKPKKAGRTVRGSVCANALGRIHIPVVLLTGNAWWPRAAQALPLHVQTRQLFPVQETPL